MKHTSIIFALLWSFFSQAKQELIEKPYPPAIGNFAHELTPFNTFSFGQNIYEKNTFLIYPYLFQCSGKNFSEIQVIPALLYCPSDSWSVYAGLPFILKEKSGDTTQRGIGNFFAQIEYALIDHSTTHDANLVTLVGGIEAPTTHYWSHDCVQTSTNYTATNFFVGLTTSRITAEWYTYASLGSYLYTTKHKVKSGTNILYEWGVGHFFLATKSITLTGLLEFNGTYAQKDTDHHCKDPDSGGNILFAGPTISITSTVWAVSGGIQLPIIPKLNGEQDKTKYRSSLFVAMSF